MIVKEKERERGKGVRGRVSVYVYIQGDYFQCDIIVRAWKSFLFVVTLHIISTKLPSCCILCVCVCSVCVCVCVCVRACVRACVCVCMGSEDRELTTPLPFLEAPTTKQLIVLASNV